MCKGLSSPTSSYSQQLFVNLILTNLYYDQPLSNLWQNYMGGQLPHKNAVPYLAQEKSFNPHVTNIFYALTWPTHHHHQTFV